MGRTLGDFINQLAVFPVMFYRKKKKRERNTAYIQIFQVRGSHGNFSFTHANTKIHGKAEMKSY